MLSGRGFGGTPVGAVLVPREPRCRRHSRWKLSGAGRTLVAEERPWHFRPSRDSLACVLPSGQRLGPLF